MSDSDFLIINKNLHRTIFELSIPGMISSILHTFFQLIDAFWVGKLGAEALAAISGCSFVLWAVFALAALSSTGIATLVAQNIGAERPDDARFVAGQGMIISTISSILFTIIVFVTQDFFYDLMGLDAAVTANAREYMSIVIIALVFSFWFTGLDAVFRALGDAKTPMKILAIALTLNAILDPFLIFGWLGLPAMGIGGAALATAITEVFAAALCVYYLKRKKFIPTLIHSQKIKIDWGIIRHILGIGAPMAFGGFFFSIIYVLLTSIIARFGTEAVAAIGICHRIEGIAWFVCMGYYVAASTLVGQNIGARRIKEAGRAASWVNLYGAATLLLVSLLYFSTAGILVSIFTSDAQVQKIAIEYLRIIAIFETFLALEVIMEGVFSGAGYTLPVMLVTVPITALRIPLAWYLALTLSWGVSGVWWAIAITTFVKGALNSGLFALGLWKKKIQPLAGTS